MSEELERIGFMPTPQTRLGKWFYKMPLFAYRMGLGWMLPPNMVVLTTYGRKSQAPRSTMLEFFNVDGTIYIASGWGEKSQWYKNLLANSLVTVQPVQGQIIYGEAQRVTDDEELVRVMRQQQSPLWAVYLANYGIEDDEADFLAKKERLHIIRIVDTGAMNTPAKLEQDLVWLTILSSIGIFLLYFMTHRPAKQD